MRKLFTYSDCLRMAETGVLSPAEKVELVHGEILLMSPPGPRHGAAVDRASDTMRELVKGKAIVRTQGTVVLDEYAAPLPDIALLTFRSDYYAGGNPGAEDILLLIEVADSSLEYDLSVKLQLYAIAGVCEYWVADLKNNRLMVHTDPDKDIYRRVRELRGGDTAAPVRFPSCRIAVDSLLP